MGEQTTGVPNGRLVQVLIVLIALVFSYLALDVLVISGPSDLGDWLFGGGLIAVVLQSIMAVILIRQASVKGPQTMVKTPAFRRASIGLSIAAVVLLAAGFFL